MTRTLGTALVACMLSVRLAAAQAAEPEHKTFFRTHDAVVAGSFLAASAGLSIFDVRLAHFFVDTAHLHVRAGRKVDKFFSHINETTLTLGGLGVYAVARGLGDRTVADVAFHMASSVAAASLTAQVIRGPLGRTRPKNTAHPFDDQYEFHYMRGFRHFEQRAFPSIHSSSGFAAASALVAEVRLRNPGSAWIVGVPAYAMALTPGLSRMYLGQHWASDIFAGAFLGTFYGWRVVDYSHSHPTTRIDRIFLGSRDDARRRFSPGVPVLRWTLTF